MYVLILLYYLTLLLLKNKNQNCFLKKVKEGKDNVTNNLGVYLIKISKIDLFKFWLVGLKMLWKILLKFVIYIPKNILDDFVSTMGVPKRSYKFRFDGDI